jgi:PAS domain S-box-containing protein
MSVPEFVCTALSDGRVDFLDHRWSEYTGLPANEAFGTTWQRAIHPDDLPWLLERWHGILAGRLPGEVEARLRRHDGEHRWFRFKLCPVIDPSGGVFKWCGVITEIEEERRREAALTAERRLLEIVSSDHSMPVMLEALSQLVENSIRGCYCSIVLVDESGTCLGQGVAPSLPASFITSILGLTLDAAAGPCAQAAFLSEEVMVADLASQTRWPGDAWCATAVAHQLRGMWSTPLLSNDGQAMGAFALYFNQPMAPASLDRDPAARFASVAGSAIERLQREAALKRKEAFLAEAQQLTKIGSFSWRSAGKAIAWSDQMYRIYEFDPAIPLTNHRIGSRIHPDDRQAVFDLLARARRAGRDIDCEYRLLMPNSSVKYLHMIAHRTSDRQHQHEYIGALQDVTERRLSEDALAKARSELAHVARITTLGAMTASIAHEVNQPLSGIMTNAETGLRMLAAEPPDVDGARETARRTIRDAQRASEVIARTRALFAKQDARTESMDLNEVTGEAIALTLSDLQRHQVLLQSDFAHELPLVTGDRIQLQQVILNLFRNALEAMSDVDNRPRRLLVKTEHDESDCVRVTVRDSGKGFDPQSVDRLFDPFFTTKSGGMGIGLSVSRAIIENHHGRLWAASNEGPGVSFSFSIPRITVYGSASNATEPSR